MKRHTLYISPLLLLPLTLPGCGPDAHSYVEGVATGGQGREQRVYLDALVLGTHGNTPTTTDSTITAAGGSFRLKGLEQTEPTFYTLRFRSAKPDDAEKCLTLLLDSAETLQVNIDLATNPPKADFANSPANQRLQQLNASAAAIAPLLKQAQEANVDSLRSRLLRHKALVQSLILADPRSMVGYYALYQTVEGLRLFDTADPADLRLFGAAGTSLSLAYPNSRQVKLLCDAVLQQRAAMRLQAKKDSLMRSAQVAGSPDFRLPDINGDTLRLSDFRGHTVLLSFWTSDNQDARRANRHLGTLYNRFGSRIKFVSVCFDTSRVLWEAASKADGINWTNLCDLRGTASLPAILYNVQQLPANYIIDPNGDLIGKDLFDHRLEEKLKGL